MTFTDQILAGIRSHTGLHYVPSFNDLCTNSNDDMESLEQDTVGRSDQAMLATAPTKPRTSNKTDDMPAMDPVMAMGDMHRVPRTSGRADWAYDNARGGRRAPSVWQYILDSQGKGNRVPSFAEMNPVGGTIGASDLQKHLKVSREQAEAMVREADRDNDKRLSQEEYHDVLSEVSA